MKNQKIFALKKKQIKMKTIILPIMAINVKNVIKNL